MGRTRRNFQFQGEKSPSIGPKMAIILWYTACVAAAVWLTFGDGGSAGNPLRQVVLLGFVLVYVFRATSTLFVFVKRKLPWWEAAWGGSLIGIVLFFFLLQGLRVPDPLGSVDVVGILLYAVGSYVGTASEYTRHLWKANAQNYGHLYTGGLFRYSRHINYLGDLLLFLGCGILTRQLWTVIVPLAMGLNFVLVIIPAHDAYLAGRYGAEFEEYSRRTKMLVPFLY